MLAEEFCLQLDPYRLPDFARITDEDWLTCFESAMASHLEVLEAIAADQGEPTPDLIGQWELAGVYLTDVCGGFWTLKDADTNDRRDEIEGIISPALARHHDLILLDSRLYQRLVRLQERIDAGEVSADDQDRFWLSEQLRTFRRSGILLSEADKTALKALNEQIAELETAYSTTVVKGRGAAAIHVMQLEHLEGLSPDQVGQARRAAEERGLNGWVIELVNTTRQPILSLLNHRPTRQRVFEASISRGQDDPWDTRETILTLVRLRLKKAQLLGFENYAAYVADDGCAKTTQAIMALLVKAADAVVVNARREADQLASELAQLLPGETLQPWDWAWLAEKTRKTAYALDEEALSAYLGFETVLTQGVFAAATRLYGLSFHARDDIAGYTDECRTFEVRNEDGSPLGLLQLDPYSRRTKQGGAWMTSLTEQAHLTGDLPVVTNNCNQSRPSAGKPSLMTWDEVTTLFHEFGHDLHGLLAHTRYPSLSGTNTPRDFVEFPSQVNEMWAWEPSVIETYARHVDTGEPMPSHLVEALLTARHFGEGFDACETFAAMLLDQVWHQASAEELPESVDQIDAFEKAALAKYGLDFSLIPPRYRSCYFSHIWGPGYAASYYGYLWAEVLDADTVAWFEENGGLTRENGEFFRKAILSIGGSEDVMEAYRRFRGTDPDPTYLFQRRGLA
ncbi:MAG: M3 family metallopeptidase [Propionibacteriaceae bacterium]|nr:M3 family metallopeptidase [Propionibacteriaceae bacterium]